MKAADAARRGTATPTTAAQHQPRTRERHRDTEGSTPPRCHSRSRPIARCRQAIAAASRRAAHDRKALRKCLREARNHRGDRAGRIASAFSTHACRRSGWPAMKNITASVPTATAPSSTRRSEPPGTPSNRAPRSRDRTRSGIPHQQQHGHQVEVRSTMIVANARSRSVPLGGPAGRDDTSPARAGNTAEAANRSPLPETPC